MKYSKCPKCGASLVAMKTAKATYPHALECVSETGIEEDDLDMDEISLEDEVLDEIVCEDDADHCWKTAEEFLAFAKDFNCGYPLTHSVINGSKIKDLLNAAVRKWVENKVVSIVTMEMFDLFNKGVEEGLSLTASYNKHIAEKVSAVDRPAFMEMGREYIIS